jgi:uncharacterized integral membrane protein
VKAASVQTELKTPLYTPGHLDFPLLVAIVVLCAFGLVMLFSASYYYAYTYKGDGFYYLKSQAMYCGAGLAAMYILSRVNYRHIEKLRVVGLVGVVLLLVLVLVLDRRRMNRSAGSRYRAQASPSNLRNLPSLCLCCTWRHLCHATQSAWEALRMALHPCS